MDKTKAEVQSEKKILIEMLQLYEQSPCLWDTSHELYSNREVRAKAYNRLFEKFKLVYPGSTVKTLRKRLENMRAGYRRERKKVVNDLLKYGDDRRTSLWYYEHMKFLDKRNTNQESEDEEVLEEEDDEGSSSKLENVSSIYLEEEHLDPEEGEEGEVEEEEDEAESYNITEKNDKNKTVLITNRTMMEEQSFGTTLGIQLNELEPEQRYIAEKLISEVIYYARFDKLDVNTKLSNV